METRIYKVPVRMDCWFTVEIPVDIQYGWDESEVFATIEDAVRSMTAMPMADDQYNFQTHYLWEPSGAVIDFDEDGVEGDFDFPQDLDEDEDE